MVIFNALKTNGGDAFTGNIDFNEITLNVGNGMNSDGFVAPLDGFYKFSFSAMGGFEKYGIDTLVDVFKNGAKALIIQVLDGSQKNNKGKSVQTNSRRSREVAVKS